MHRMLFVFVLLPLLAVAGEAEYARAFCNSIGGQAEVVLTDRTRVDCMTPTHVIEVDYDYKWYEGVGQALHYATVTGKRPGVALIVSPGNRRYIERLLRLHVHPRITVFEVPR